MKKVLLGLIVLASLASCKKSSDDITCDVSVAGIAASYKLTNLTAYFPSPLPDQDQTSSLSSCDLSGIYQLKSDKTVVYTETGGSCSNSGTGTWDVVAGKLSLSSPGYADLSNVPVTGWDCGTLTLSEDFGSGAGLRYTFTKQ